MKKICKKRGGPSGPETKLGLRPRPSPFVACMSSKKTLNCALKMEEAARAQADEMREKAEALMRETELSAAKAKQKDRNHLELVPSEAQQQKEEHNRKKQEGPPTYSFP
eukprot:9169681-Pyramimonas_sp.AAC.1